MPDTPTQSEADFDRGSTVPLRQHLQNIVEVVERQLRREIESQGVGLSRRMEAESSRVEGQFAAQEKGISTAMTAAEKAILAAMTAAKEAVLKAEVASDKRFEGVNEFRQSLNDMVLRLLPRTEGEERLKAMAEKIDAGTAQLALMIRRDEVAERFKAADAAVASLASRMDKKEGSGAGMNQSWLILVGAIAAIGVIVGLVNFLTGQRAPPVVIERPAGP